MQTRPTDVRFRLLIVLAALGCLPASVATAQSIEDGPSDLRFSGFGTLGVTHAAAPAGWRYRRDISQPGSSGDTSVATDSRLGLQANYAPSARFELVGQLVATRRSGDADRASPVEWAFAAFRPSESLTVRFGRLAFDAYLISDYRDVGFAYPFVRPPVDFYAVSPKTFDGVDVTQTWTSGAAAWRGKAYVGQGDVGDLSRGPPTRLKELWGLAVSREADGLLLRASFFQGRLGSALSGLGPLHDALGNLAATVNVSDIAAQALELRSLLGSPGDLSRYAAVGARYDLDAWQLTAEYARLFGPNPANLSVYYVNAARRFDSITVFGGVSRIGRRSAQVQAPAWGATLAPLVGQTTAQQIQALGSAAAFVLNAEAGQRTWSLGARWDLHPQVALKAQWDHVSIDATGSALWANGSAEAGRANVFSTTLDFVF